MPEAEPTRAEPAPERIVVAANPRASFGRHPHAGRSVARALRTTAGPRPREVVLVEEESYGALVARAREETERRPDALVVVGGDGMVNLGVTLTATTGIPLGIVPTGTGNDMARALGLPRNDLAASVARIETALAAGPRRVDAVRTSRGEGADAERGWFGAVLSAGFDAAVNERANRLTRPRGASRYVVALVIELARLAPRRYRLTTDAGEETVDAIIVAAANGESLGGGMRLAPDTPMDDGTLDLVVIAPMTRTRLLRELPRVFSGRHLDLPEVSIRRTRRATIAADGVVAYADGERLGETPVALEVVPGALSILG